MHGGCDTSAIGGYLAGRMRTKITGLHTNEVFFRDTAHGFLAWAFATLITLAAATAYLANELLLMAFQDSRGRRSGAIE